MAAKKIVKKNSQKPVKSLQEEALLLHAKHQGKIAVNPKLRVKNRKDLSLVYTPGVGAVSMAIAKDKRLADKYTIRKNTVAVISDGSAVLGLGNIGPEAAMPVMEGKAVLFKELGGIDAFPIVLASQDPAEIIATVKNLAPTFGGVNLEDIAAPQCFMIEKALQKELSIPVLHDDQHGTALVVLAGLINALKVAGKKKEKVRVVISGAGAAGQAVAHLLSLYGIQQIFVVDSEGVISGKRKNLTESKKALLAYTNKENFQGSLKEVIVDADVFIGVSQPNLLDRIDIAKMNQKAIVFALANPVPEITPDEAKAGGAYIVATGRSDYANQINNALGFPGIFRGALDNNVRAITDEMLVRAAKNLAAVVKNPKPDMIIPGVFDRAVMPAVARAIREKK
ncbi:MAG: NADP-dependent malic enzyme [Candidatus Moranbacteria bacterium]|nr:NADP-dependent malic enzyme [Candidatus Moranbacteria bacterium]